MLRWIVRSSLRIRSLVLIIAGTMMVFATIQLREMPVDVLPEFSPPYVEIQTEALGLSAEETEQMITVPMEVDLLSGVAWLKSMRSETIPGLSSIVIEFQPGTDILRARQMVQERLIQAPNALPNTSKAPVMLQPLSSTSRVMMIGLTSEEMSHIDMSVLARWTIRPRLMGVPGVANVAIWGQRKRQLQVQVEPERMRDQGVSVFEVVRATGNALWVSPLSFIEASTTGTGGFIDTPNQRLGIRHVMPILTPGDLAEVSFKGSKGQTLQLGDVANVVVDHQPLIGDAIVDDGPGLLLVVEKFPDANTLKVTRELEIALNELKPGLGGIDIDSTVYRPATFLESSIGNISMVLIVASTLVVLVLGLFHFDWRSVLISVVSIPLSLTAAVFVIFLQGTTMNTMVLVGLVIALGAVIDNAIIDVDNIMRRLRQHRQEGSDRPRMAIILEASCETRGAILFAALITLLVAVPFFFLQGLAGALLQPLALSYVLAVLASMVVALTVTPALSLLLLSFGPVQRRESPLVRWLRRGYDVVLGKIIHTPHPAYLAVIVAVVVGLGVLPWLGQSLLPDFKENDLLIRWEGAPGTSRPAMNRTMIQASRELQSIPGVENVGAHTGRAVQADQVVGINSGEIWVSVDPKADYDATVAAVEQVIGGYPGLSRHVGTYLEEKVGDTLVGTDEDVVVRIYGENLELIRRKAEEIRQGLSGIDGIVNPMLEFQAQEPEIVIEVDLQAAAGYGITPGEVRRATTTLVSGLEVGSLFEEQKVFDVVVLGVPELRDSLTDIRQLMIDTPGGGHVRLEDVADVRIEPVLTVIKREAAQRTISITADVQGRSLGSVNREVRRYLQGVDFPLEHHAKLIGESQERQAERWRILTLSIAAVIGILFLMQAAFGRWRLAGLVCLTLPAALVGGVIAIFASGGVISLGSLAGLLLVLGIASRNIIMQIRHYQHLQRAEGETFGSELVRRGAGERFGPILATAVATALAFLPWVIAGNIPGNEIIHSMAVVVLGGLVTSTLLNLLVLPTLYLHFGSSSEPETLELELGTEPQVST